MFSVEFGGEICVVTRAVRRIAPARRDARNSSRTARVPPPSGPPRAVTTGHSREITAGGQAWQAIYPSRMSARRNLIISAVSNLSTAYNLVVINVVHVIIEYQYCGGPSNCSAEIASASTSCLAGAIVGQLAFGYIGDCLGRPRALQLTMAMSILGALASAFAVPVSSDPASIFAFLTITRFFLGVGVGGVYPLSATIASESSETNARGRNASLVFSMQGVANLLVPLVAWALLQVCPVLSRPPALPPSRPPSCPPARSPARSPETALCMHAGVWRAANGQPRGGEWPLLAACTRPGRTARHPALAVQDQLSRRRATQRGGRLPGRPARAQWPRDGGLPLP